jgi:hypothetical protein
MWIEIPRIDVDDVFGTGDWDTKIQIQNVGDGDTWVEVYFWEAYSELCPPNEPGDFYDVAMWVPEGGVWTLHSAIPAGAESAFIFSDGEPVAVTVDRWGPDAFGELEISSSYTGIADDSDMIGPGPPFEYFAPYVMHGYSDLDTTITIQNSGEICASIWIYDQEEGNCEFMKAQHIEQIAPGEAIRIGPGSDADMGYPSPELDVPWLGSAYVTANVPLAIIVDQLSLAGANRGTLLTMRGMPYQQQPEFKWYADLLYREISGWSSGIQVQNLTLDSQPTFVTVDFFDQSGDEILFVGDWVCRNGATTFYLPAIVDLGVNFPLGYVGAAEIESHMQVDYPGGWHEGEPIFVVVDLKKTNVYDESLPGWRHTVAGETQGGAYNAHPEHQKVDAWGWAMPFIAKEQEGVTSRIAIRNNANCNKISGYVDIFDETGNVVTTIPVPWLHPKHMKVLDLAYFGQIARGFVGAAQFWVTGLEQLCDTDFDGETDILPVMPSVVVVNYGFEAELPIGSGAGPQTTEGDLTRVYEATPFDYRASPCEITVSGNVIDQFTLDPVTGADIHADGMPMYETDSTGYYTFNLPTAVGAVHEVTAEKTGYFAGGPEDAFACDDSVSNFELEAETYESVITGQLLDKETGDPIAGADVWAMNCEGGDATTTDADGFYVLALHGDVWCTTWLFAGGGFWEIMTESFMLPPWDWAVQDFELKETPCYDGQGRVLIYRGNGGDVDLDLTLFTEFAGADRVDDTTVFPTGDLFEYKTIFLLTPGLHDDQVISGLGPNTFTMDQVARLQHWVNAESASCGFRRLVLVGDGSEDDDPTTAAYSNAVANQFLLDMGLAADDGLVQVYGIQFDMQVPCVPDAIADDFPPLTQVTDEAGTELGTIHFDCSDTLTVINVGPAWDNPLELALINATHATNAGDCVMAAGVVPGSPGTPGNGADVIVTGDNDWMGDLNISVSASSGFFNADNENLAYNLLYGY